MCIVKQPFSSPWWPVIVLPMISLYVFQSETAGRIAYMARQSCKQGCYVQSAERMKQLSDIVGLPHVAQSSLINDYIGSIVH